MTWQQMTLVIAIMTMLSVTLQLQLAYSSTIEIPSYSDKPPITGPNGTNMFDVENGTETAEIPFVNGTATINVEEYQRCVDGKRDSYLQTQREMDVNTLDPAAIKDIEDHVKISMQNCIYLNSANTNNEETE